MKKQKTFLGIPYDFQKPTVKKFKSRVWNKKDHNLFNPKVYGWGYTINFYELFHRKKLLLALLLIILLYAVFVFR